MTDITPEQQQKLEELSKALRTEFALTEDQRASHTALQDLQDLKPDMLNALKNILRHTQNDSLKGKVAMWGYDRLLEEGKATKDPLADLLSQMPAASNSTD